MWWCRDDDGLSILLCVLCCVCVYVCVCVRMCMSSPSLHLLFISLIMCTALYICLYFLHSFSLSLSHPSYQLLLSCSLNHAPYYCPRNAHSARNGTETRKRGGKLWCAFIRKPLQRFGARRCHAAQCAV